MNSIRLIEAERIRQIEEEGYNARHDSFHVNGELRRAAICYLEHDGSDYTPIKWPWFCDTWKPSTNHVRNLVKAAALIAAEIDRLQQ